MPGFGWISKSSRPTPVITGEVFLNNRVKNYVTKECYSIASIRSTSSPMSITSSSSPVTTEPSASNPTYTINSSASNPTYTINSEGEVSSSTGVNKTIFNSSTNPNSIQTITVINNMNDPSESVQSGSTFYVYNYSSLTIAYNISQNDITSDTIFITPQTYDTWTWINNYPAKAGNQFIPRL